MNLKENQRRNIQQEINRINATLNSQILERRVFEKLNRRRSQLIRTAKTLHLKIHAV